MEYLGFADGTYLLKTVNEKSSTGAWRIKTRLNYEIFIFQKHCFQFENSNIWLKLLYRISHLNVFITSLYTLPTGGDVIDSTLVLLAFLDGLDPVLDFRFGVFGLKKIKHKI